MDFDFDRYFSLSIKDAEHELRNSEQETEFFITGPKQARSMDFNKLLKSFQFKQSFAKFIMMD